MIAYAVAITEENIRGIIRSEAGPAFNLDWSLDWLDENEEGWFLRDAESTFDCQFFRPEVFGEYYSFVEYDEKSVLQEVVKI